MSVQTPSTDVHCQNCEHHQQLIKANKDLARLRTHLIEMEETHTADQIVKEEKIHDLSKKLEELTSREVVFQTKESELESLKRRLYKKEEECQQLESAISNLQNVLERLQAGKNLTRDTSKCRDIRFEENSF